MILPIEPVPKPRMTQRDRWAKRPAVVRYYAFCDELRALYKGEVPEQVMLVFNVPMPKSWSKTKQLEMEGQPHKQRPDIDNLVKAVLDALCEDDSYVHTVVATKIWAKEGSIHLTTFSRVVVN